MEKKESITSILIVQEKTGTHVQWYIPIFTNQRDGGKISCYLPGFEIFFSAKDTETAKIKATTLAKFFFDHYLLDRKNKKIGFKRLMIDLNKKGFRDKAHNDVMFKSMKGLPVKATMKSAPKDAPEGYRETNSIKEEMFA